MIKFKKAKMLFSVLAVAFIAIMLNLGSNVGEASANGLAQNVNTHYNIDSTTPDGWHYEGVAHFVFEKTQNNSGGGKVLNHTNLTGTVTSPDGTVYKWIGNLKEAGTRNNSNDGNTMYNFTERYIGSDGTEKIFLHEVTIFDIENGEWIEKLYHVVD